jgi:hypothetical protein
VFAHHAVVLESKVQALFNLGAVGVDERLPKYLLRELLDLGAGEAAVEAFFEDRFEASDADEWVGGAGIADHAPHFLLDRW